MPNAMDVTGSINVRSEPGRVILDCRQRDNGGEWQAEKYPVYLDTTPRHMGGECAFNRVGRLGVFSVFSRKVTEGLQQATIVGQLSEKAGGAVATVIDISPSFSCFDRGPNHYGCRYCEAL